MIVSLIFLGSSLPHAEFLRCERSLDRMACTKGQRFGALWTTGELSLVIKPGTMASSIVQEINNHLRYGFDSSFTWEEDVWWWAIPFAFVAIVVGILVTGLSLCTNVWLFDLLCEVQSILIRRYE
jgi:hypothetical protein